LLSHMLAQSAFRPDLLATQLMSALIFCERYKETVRIDGLIISIRLSTSALKLRVLSALDSFALFHCER